ncbi:SPOR domain-containing protein [Sulfurimonas sp. HSL-1716]|uniref:SPOR domain-containing protein n=1 Tax=Hydrocurvibacter sulfurireducens TaxID=3131937 RepID=UPI0031F7D3F6
MEERNELNDIILNKGNDAASSSKKVILVVAILTIILIVVVMIMKNSGSSTVENLPQAQDTAKTNLPPEPPSPQADAQQNSSLFEPVEIVKEDKKTDDDLDKIAKKLKQESLTQNEMKPVQETAKPSVKPSSSEAKAKKPTKAPAAKTTGTKKIYVQVGSFAKYEPDKKFLASIKKLGYEYSYHKVQRNGKTINKVLVGPFTGEADAREALKNIRKNIEPGAFITKK